MSEWKQIKIATTKIKNSMKRSLYERLGPDATLGDLSELSIDELREIPYVGEKAIESVFEAVRVAMQGIPPKPSVNVLEAALEASNEEPV